MEEIKAQKKMGLSTGLFHIPRYSVDPFKPVDNRIRRLVDGDLVQMLVYGEKVSCDLLIIRYPPILQEPQEYVLDIEASKLCVIVNQTPKRDYGEEGQFVYDIKNCVNNLNNYFDQTGVWYPIGPLVRNTLMNYHADELSIIKFADKNWSNIIDIDEWKRQSRPKRRSKIRIGRHSRDQYVKWPSDPDTISYIYPDSSEYEVHLLGGAQVPIELLGYKPANWLVLEFGEIDPKDFLEQLDVFVYYTHPDWVESFGRVILEAMAVGVPVILPHVYRELFKESAIYAKPDEVQKAINKLMDDDSYYEAQVRKAYNFVKNNFGYDAHENRLKELLKK